MRVTITIEDEQEARVKVERAEAGEAVKTSPEPPAEPKPTSAGGPPPWLYQQIEGTTAEPEEAQTSTGPVDAGPAPSSEEDGFASALADLTRGPFGAPTS